MYGVAKQKVWHNRFESWKYPMVKVRILGPAGDMSTTSKGYYVQDVANGNFMRSTVIRVPGPRHEGDSTEKGGPSEPPALGSVEDTTRDGRGGQGSLADLEESLEAGERPQLVLQGTEERAHYPIAHDPPRRRVHGKSAPQVEAQVARCQTPAAVGSSHEPGEGANGGGADGPDGTDERGADGCRSGV